MYICTYIRRLYIKLTVHSHVVIKLLPGTKSATCYPVSKFTTAIGGSYSNAPVVVDGTLVTSQGPGTSLLFALKLVEILFGPEKARLISEEMIAQF